MSRIVLAFPAVSIRPCHPLARGAAGRGGGDRHARPWSGQRARTRAGTCAWRGRRSLSCARLPRRVPRESSCPALQAGALYEGHYPLSSALARPLIARRLVEIAEDGGRIHGRPRRDREGQQPGRLGLSIRALDPSLTVLAPARDWGMNRAEELAFTHARGMRHDRCHRSGVQHRAPISGAGRFSAVCSTILGRKPRPRSSR